MDTMPDFRAPSNPDPTPLPTLAAILARFARLGYGIDAARPVPPLSAILALFDRLGYGARGAEGGI